MGAYWSIPPGYRRRHQARAVGWEEDRSRRARDRLHRVRRLLERTRSSMLLDADAGLGRRRGPMAEFQKYDAGVPSKATRTISWILTGFAGLFLLVDGGARLAGFAPYVEGLTKFGYAASLAPWIGLVLLASTILMLIPRTAMLGCILVTGYLG